MRTELCDRLGIEFPIFAFTHCRDVVAAVSNAGGMGVLGAVGYTVEQLETELAWIDEHTDKPYGVDVVIPGKYEGMGEMDPIKLEQDLLTMVPDEHRRFVKKILADHNVPELPEDELPPALIGWTEATASPLIDAALRHPKVRLIANALGTPPDEVIQRVHESGRLIAALCGSPKQALHHKDANVDIIIAQGTEGGGHTGDVGSVVLWPQVIDAVYPIPVLAAGGIGTGRQVAAALAMGAEGVWTGSIWLTVEEADQAPAQVESLLAATSRDTVRSRSWTGKPCRMLRNEWTDAWEDPANPDPLGMPLQFMVTGEAVARGHHYSQQAKDVNFNPVGQIVGTMNKVRKTKDLIADMVDEYLECSNRLEMLNERAAGAEIS
ncbi:2-nitropropane dioxygenase-like enzyme [Actinobacteria bacterium IMCC26207]|nr:2-nitropropane dioxygenase-like enzyme [Actinobacteria bacterium IMCC26207]